MIVIRIERPDDPRIADYHDVPEPELVRARGLFIAEGRFVTERLIQDGRCAVRSVLLNAAAFRALEPTLATLASHVPVYLCDAAHFHAITGFRIHRGCLALAERPPTIATCEILRDAHTLVVLEGVSNADNVGGVFRNVAAFGADAVMLSPVCCDPLYRKAIRTSMGATLRVPFATIADWPSGLGDVRATGFTIVALSPRQPSHTLDQFLATGRPDRVALLVGTEGAGLTAAAESTADVCVRIPMTTQVDSLNLAVATGIALARLSGGVAL